MHRRSEVLGSRRWSTPVLQRQRRIDVRRADAARPVAAAIGKLESSPT